MKTLKTALVLTLVGLLCGALIGVANYITAPIIKQNAEKRAREAYKSFFTDLDAIEEHELDENTVYVYIDIKQGESLLGYVFKAKGTNQRGLLDLAVAFDVDGKVVGVKILETENTAGFYDQYIDDKNNTLVGLNNDDGLSVDNISGVTQTGNLINTLLKDISTSAKTHIKPTVEVDLYKDLFANKETVEVDTTFTPNEKVLKKEIIKDVDGNVLGSAYTLTGKSTTPLHDYDDSGENFITLLVGVDADNKFTGVLIKETDHTKSYYELHDDYFNELVGTLVSEAPVDNISGATITRTIIRELIDALKAVLA